MAHSVQISWTTSIDQVDGYNIYRGVAGSGTETTAPINSALVAATTFTDTSVSEGEKLAYFVTSVKSGVESVHSNEVTAVILPAPPTGLVVTAVA